MSLNLKSPSVFVITPPIWLLVFCSNKTTVAYSNLLSKSSETLPIIWELIVRIEQKIKIMYKELFTIQKLIEDSILLLMESLGRFFEYFLQ